MKTKTKITKITIGKGGKVRFKRSRVKITSRKKKNTHYKQDLFVTILLVILAIWAFGGSKGETTQAEGNAPQNPKIEATEEIKPEYKEVTRVVTQYNVGDPYQTDQSPCIGAYAGINLCHEVAVGNNVCASNEFKKGAVLEIEGLGRCVVLDRMNERYKTNIDWAMEADQKPQAIKFGAPSLKVKIISE